MTLRPLAIFLFSCTLFSCNAERKKQVTVQQQNTSMRPPVRADAYIAETSVLLDKIEIPGSVVPNQTAEVHPEVSGLVKQVYFTEGAHVGKGALLVKINDNELQAQKRKLQVQLQIARQNESRSAELLKIQGISRQDYEATLLQVNNINADLAIIQTQIEKTNVRAPFAGKVGFRQVSPGAYVSPATVITNISQTSQLKIDFTVPEKYISNVRTGQYVNFQVDGSNRNYSARIVATEPSLTSTTRTMQVRAAVVGDQAGLTPGNFARVRFNFDPDPNAIMIPTQAIIPQARGKRVFLYQNGIAKAVDVTTGIRDSSRVQIVQGVSAGDTILITGLLSIKPDAKVTLGKVVNRSSAQASPGREGAANKSSTTTGQN